MSEFKFSEEFVKIHGFINYQFISNEDMGYLLNEMNTALKMPIENVDELSKTLLFSCISRVEEAGFNSDFFNVGFGTGVFVTALDANSQNPAITDIIAARFEKIIDTSDEVQNTKYFSCFKVQYKAMEAILEAIDFIFSYTSPEFDGLEDLRKEINNAAYVCDFLSLGYFIGAFSYRLKITEPLQFDKLSKIVKKAFKLE